MYREHNSTIKTTPNFICWQKCSFAKTAVKIKWKALWESNIDPIMLNLNYIHYCTGINEKAEQNKKFWGSRTPQEEYRKKYCSQT